MAERKIILRGGKGKKKRYHRAFAQGAATTKLDYKKSAIVGLENDTFNVGAWSDPAKFSKLLRNIKNYIQKTYKEPDDIVKTIQQMKKADLAYPEKPKKDDPECLDDSGNPDPDAFEMAVFAWKKDYKSMKYRMERYKGNESNAWA
jgi:hypothetical protein